MTCGSYFTFRTLKEISDCIPSVANSNGILHPNNVTASIKNLGKTYEGRERQMISMSLEVSMDNSCSQYKDVTTQYSNMATNDHRQKSLTSKWPTSFIEFYCIDSRDGGPINNMGIKDI